MTVVKDDDDLAGTEAAGAIQVDQTEGNELELMTDSKLPDDWSIVGSKGLDNEGSDGESVEVIPCEEEKSEGSTSADSVSPLDAISPLDATTPNELAIQTRENIMQTEEVAFFQNFTVLHPGIMALFIICHLVITLAFYSVINDPGEFPDLRKEALSSNIRPALIELVEDWEQMSSRSPEDKAHIISFLKNHFPLDTFDEEIVALLEKDMMQDSTVSPFHKKRRYSPNPPPPADEPSKKYPSPSNKNPEDTKFDPFDCSNCKKYSSDCKKFCKHYKGKGLKYYYDKIVAPVVKKFPNFKNKF